MSDGAGAGPGGVFLMLMVKWLGFGVEDEVGEVK